MPIRLPNGKYRVQVRIKGHPRIDQVFATKKAATEFEGASESASRRTRRCTR